ncbi:hypothetical protein ACFYWX_35120 [Streptomyces sp. NPDC002888]|uniref:hypothetical protein n=1 Tax=Streptomyces sp. NPDC002888 TaxID=3364668 RepID=UPI00369454DC
MTDAEVSEAETGLVGSIVEGEATAVFRWGVIVDLGLSRDGLIDVLYIDDDDNYEVGDRVSCCLDGFDEMKNKFILRPPGQLPLAERLRKARERRVSPPAPLDAAGIARFLLSLDRFQKQLDAFMLGAYLACDFGGDFGDDGDSTLSPQVRLDVVDGAPQVTLDHAITWMDRTRDQELSEYRLAVTLTFAEAGITVEAFVRLDLERDMGEWPAGVHIPYRQRADGLVLDEALAFVEARVGELCQRYDDVNRLGLGS